MQLITEKRQKLIVFGFYLMLSKNSRAFTKSKLNCVCIFEIKTTLAGTDDLISPRKMIFIKRKIVMVLQIDV